MPRRQLLRKNKSFAMESNEMIKVNLNRSQSSPEKSLLFVDVNRSISDPSADNLLRNCEKLPPSESGSSNGSEGKPESSRKKILPSDTIVDTAIRLKSYFFNDNIFKNSSEEYLKTKVLGFWHSMKYGLASNIRTNFSKETAICMLGKAYHRTFTVDNHECSNIDRFKRDFQSVLWFTYRQKFSALEGTKLTSDCGWGCMIRTGQMMIASALKKLILPRGWIYNLDNTSVEIEKHKKIISWFSDFPSPCCPFSIHNLVKLGNKLNKQAGNWYGPSCICYIFRDAFNRLATTIPELEKISVIISQDGGVYLQDVIVQCSSDCCICPAEVGCDALTKDKSGEELSNSSPTTLRSAGVTHPEESNDSNYSAVVQEAEKVSITFDDLCNRKTQTECQVCEHWKPCIILVPMRLGGNSVNSLYYQCVFSLLLHDLCIGIIGGKPSHSLYFVGFQDKYLIHIDPHLIQDTVPLNETSFDFSSFHCSVPRKLSISKMDPSAAVGFFCPTKSDFIRLVKEIPQLVSVKDGKLDSKLFEFIDSKSPIEEFVLEDFDCEIVDASSDTYSMDDEELIW